MKDMKRFLSLAFFLFLGTAMVAQITIGVRGGINLARMNEDVFSISDNLEIGTMVGLNAAAFANFKVGETFSFQPELQFIQKGLQEQGTLPLDGVETNVELTYRYSFIEVPLLGRFDFGTEDINVYVFAGPAFGYAMSGEFSGENYKIGNEGGVQNGTFEQDLEWDTEYGSNGVKDARFDLSGVVGAGVDFNLDGTNKIVVDARYNHDFLDMVDYEVQPSPEPDAIFNRGIAITVGYAYVIGN